MPAASNYEEVPFRVLLASNAVLTTVYKEVSIPLSTVRALTTHSLN